MHSHTHMARWVPMCVATWGGGRKVKEVQMVYSERQACTADGRGQGGLGAGQNSRGCPRAVKGLGGVPQQ